MRLVELFVCLFIWLFDCVVLCLCVSVFVPLCVYLLACVFVGLCVCFKDIRGPSRIAISCVKHVCVFVC